MTGIQGKDSRKRDRLTLLIRRYEKDLLRICYVYLHDADLARDAVQDTFLKAWTHLDSLREEEKEKSWLARIAVNVCRDYLRSSWTRHINRYVRPEDLQAAAEQPDGTRAALTAAAVTLRYVQGYDIREAAGILGITPSAVSRRCRKACVLLKSELEGREEPNG